jgi:hypothetical protein
LSCRTPASTRRGSAAAGAGLRFATIPIARTTGPASGWERASGPTRPPPRLARKARLSSWRLDGLTREYRRLLNSQRPAPHHARGQTWLLLAHRAKTARQQAWARRYPLSIERAKGPDCPIDRCRNGRRGGAVVLHASAADNQRWGSALAVARRPPAGGDHFAACVSDWPVVAAAAAAAVAFASHRTGVI